MAEGYTPGSENSEGRDEPGKKSLAFPPAIAGKGICFASNSKGT